MAFPRFYCPNINAPQIGETAFLDDNAHHHAGRSLRLANGEYVTLFDGSGKTYTGPVTIEKKQSFIVVESVETPTVESPVQTTLVQALVSNEKMDWIVEKAVELGVHEIVLIPTERSVTKLSEERAQKRIARLQDIIVAACMQSGRTRIPSISLSSLPEVLLRQADARIMLAPGANKPAQLTHAKSVIFAVGPEGGFSPKEIQTAIDAGWQCALVGPRVLRTETAGLVALTLANVATGDFTID